MQTEWTLVEEWAQAHAWDEIEALLFKKVPTKDYNYIYILKTRNKVIKYLKS